MRACEIWHLTRSTECSIPQLDERQSSEANYFADIPRVADSSMVALDHPDVIEEVEPLRRFGEAPLDEASPLHRFGEGLIESPLMRHRHSEALVNVECES